MENPVGRPMLPSFMPQRTGWYVALLALVLAFGFLGSRGIWDPDEGRYTNVAMNMLASGDWLTPMRNHETGHWTKPPLTYWAIASSVGALGATPWAARLPVALSYLACVLLAWLIARRLVPGREAEAAIVYATMGFTALASNLLTTDYLLAATETAAVWAFVEVRFGKPERPLRWVVLMWFFFGLAFLTKGPPALLPLLALLVFDRLVPGQAVRLFRLPALAVFAAVALPWYAAVALRNPGLLEYLLAHEVVNRVATDRFDRNGEWYGWLYVYAPVLLLGTLPWTRALFGAVRAGGARIPIWFRDRDARTRDSGWLLLLVWIVLPLLVFCIARSRMPLYLLPLFVPLALLVAMQLQATRRSLPAMHWLLLWVVLLLVFKFGTSIWTTHKDASGWADAVRQRMTQPAEEFLFVDDMPRFGLHLELGYPVQIERLSLEDSPADAFMSGLDGSLQSELQECKMDRRLWITKEQNWAAVAARIEALGYTTRVVGEPYRQRVMFEVF